MLKEISDGTNKKGALNPSPFFVNRWIKLHIKNLIFTLSRTVRTTTTVYFMSLYVMPFSFTITDTI
jgi:hypothetical protein